MQGFAATSGGSAGPTSPAPPVDAVPDYLSSSDLEAEGSDIEASDIEASDLDDEESRLASDGAELGTDGPATTGQLQVPTIDGVSQQEEDALLNKIQSSSKKHQRYAPAFPAVNHIARLCLPKCVCRTGTGCASTFHKNLKCACSCKYALSISMLNLHAAQAPAWVLRRCSCYESSSHSWL